MRPGQAAVARNIEVIEPQVALKLLSAAKLQSQRAHPAEVERRSVVGANIGERDLIAVPCTDHPEMVRRVGSASRVANGQREWDHELRGIVHMEYEFAAAGPVGGQPGFRTHLHSRRGNAGRQHQMNRPVLRGRQFFRDSFNRRVVIQGGRPFCGGAGDAQTGNTRRTIDPVDEIRSGRSGKGRQSQRDQRECQCFGNRDHANTSGKEQIMITRLALAAPARWIATLLQDGTPRRGEAPRRVRLVSAEDGGIARDGVRGEAICRP